MTIAAGLGERGDVFETRRSEGAPREQGEGCGGLYLCPTEVRAGSAEDSQWLLVDVRSADEYSVAHIPGSINVASPAIKSTTFLRDKKIVLVDRGYADSSLRDLRDSLTERGFSQVFILDGGLNAWRQVVGPLEGDALAQRRLNWITAQQFFREREDKEWTMIDVSGWGMLGGGEAAAQGTAVRGRATDLEGLLSGKLDEQSPDARRILILNEDGTGYEAVEQVVAELGWINVFYLEGGRRSYEAYLETQQAMWNRKPGQAGAMMNCGVKRP